MDPHDPAFYDPTDDPAASGKGMVVSLAIGLGLWFAGAILAVKLLDWTGG